MNNSYDTNPSLPGISEDYINFVIQRENKIRQVMGNHWMLDYEMLTFYFGEHKGDPWRQADILDLIYDKIDKALNESASDEEQKFLKTLYCFDF
ncbi:hypothetical protein [Diplocloster agilis]|uniref:hypothetical protein n=1 Tax=Diplocloster agilis TaxID=2850323 RepID=UPI0008215629|nr:MULTISPECIES: hypothetical protein [Lachnospiraceae]MBU9746853.1 hypothetical protein [Diplocloster agilis]MCU6734880.1 hypothetical protein [Suonthocola fibrivorans]SCJ58018.1 Uncharacterised protein [uncultured Clostridium sp.]